MIILKNGGENVSKTRKDGSRKMSEKEERRNSYRLLMKTEDKILAN